MKNVVGLDGQPVATETLANKKQVSVIDARLAQRLRETDAFKVQSYLDSLLEFDDRRRLDAFVLDRAELLREWADLLLNEADHIDGQQSEPEEHYDLGL